MSDRELLRQTMDSLAAIEANLGWPGSDHAKALIDQHRARITARLSEPEDVVTVPRDWLVRLERIAKLPERWRGHVGPDPYKHPEHDAKLADPLVLRMQKQHAADMNKLFLKLAGELDACLPVELLDAAIKEQKHD